MFQRVYNFFHNLKTPPFLVKVLQDIQDIMLAILLQVGLAYLKQIEDKIIELASSNMPNKDKFNSAVKFARNLIPDIKDNSVNLLIEALVAKLKVTGFARVA